MYYPGETIHLDDGKYQVLKVDNTSKLITIERLNTLETKVETIALDKLEARKKKVGFWGAFIFGTVFWFCFILLAIEVYK